MFINTQIRSSLSGIACHYLQKLSINKKVGIAKYVLFILSLLSLTYSLNLKNNTHSLANKKLALLGAFGCLTTPFIKVVNQRCNLIIGSKKIKTGLCSTVMNLYHLSAYLLASKTGILNKTYHFDKAEYYAEKKFNAYYQLIGSEARVINFPASAKKLIRTKNEPSDEINSKAGFKQIEEKVKSLLINPSEPYLDYDYKVEMSFEKGVCQGMTQLFISKYHRGRSAGLDFEEAALKAAEPLANGATKLACALQQIHIMSKINEEKLKQTFSEDDEELMRATARGFIGHILLGSKISIGTILFSSASEIAQLGDGAYDISVGWNIMKDEEGQWYELREGHAMALLIKDQSFLIFDPNIGLFLHPDPDRYFEVLRHTDNGFAVCTKVTPQS